jgi:hypothetical protein
MTHLNAEGDERIKQDYLAKYCWWFDRCIVYFRPLEVVWQVCALKMQLKRR